MSERGVESDERVIHRIEAFTDIVIGFSLAQLGVNLVIPAHAIEIYRHPIGLFAFVMTFLVVCRMWWSHHRLFTHYFVPRMLPIVLCFATLGVLVFAIYSLQLFVHLGMTDPVAMLTYLGAFGLLFVLLGCQYLTGVVLRAGSLRPDIAAQGTRNCIRQIVFGVAFLAGASVLGAYGATPEALEIFGVAIIVLSLVSRLIMRRMGLYKRAAQVG